MFMGKEQDEHWKMPELGMESSGQMEYTKSSEDIAMSME